MDGGVRVWLLGSGSRGNAVLVDDGATRVLVDAGFSARELARRLAVVDLPPRAVDAVIITHEHTDHAKGAWRAATKWGWSVHATAGTLANVPELADVDVRTFDRGATLSLGTMTALAVPTPHDASESVGVVLTVERSGARVGVVTDLGAETVGLRNALRDLDVLVLEANHDETMLAEGPYPDVVRRRIASRTGHLSNVAAGRLARACIHPQLRHIVLAHISEQCNTPRIALSTVSSALAGSRFRGRLNAAAQDVVCGVGVAAGRSSRGAQLSLAL